MASDLILTTAQDQFQEWQEAKQAVSCLKEEPEVVEVPPADESAPSKSSPMRPKDNKEALSLQWVLEIMQGILEHIHATQLQALYEMGSTHELDRTLSHALMAEFTRVQLAMGKDLTWSLIALRLELENSSQTFLSGVSRVLNLQPTDPAAHEVKALLDRFHQALTIKVHLPLLELQAAWEELEGFLQQCLQEIGSRTETRELMERLAGKMTAHTNQVHDLVSIPELAQEEVALQVMVGQATTPSLNTNVFTGILDGLIGRLGLSPPGTTGPPVLAREGVSRQWATTLREVVLKTEGRAFHARLVTPDVLPPGL